jgi:hypothetical protein
MGIAALTDPDPDPWIRAEEFDAAVVNHELQNCWPDPILFRIAESKV